MMSAMASRTNPLKTLTLLRKLVYAYEVSPATLHKQKGKLIEFLREKAEQASNFEVARKMRVAKGFYTLEMAPPSTNEIGQIRNDIQMIIEFIKNKCFMHLTVRQAWLLLLVTIEVGLWFFLGETFGKFHIVGYKVD